MLEELEGNKGIVDHHHQNQHFSSRISSGSGHGNDSSRLEERTHLKMCRTHQEDAWCLLQLEYHRQPNSIHRLYCDIQTSFVGAIDLGRTMETKV